MYSEGYLHLFTNLFGWHYYGVLWSLLSGTGLVFLPILGVLIDHIGEVRSRGSLINNNGESALAGLEVQLFLMMMVMLIAAVPSSFTTIDPSASKYKSETTAYEDSVTATIADPKSTYGDATKSTGSNKPNAASSGPSVPVWWYLVVNVSEGIKHAMMEQYDTKGDSFRAIRRIANQASIKNPELRDHVSTFNTHCYLPALSRFNKNKNSADFVTPAAGTPAAGATVGPDVGWIGSQYLHANYYPSMRVPVLVSGFAFDDNVSTEYESAQTDKGGQPLCSVYWEKIRGEIFKEAKAEGFDGVLTRIKAIFPPWVDTDMEQQVAMTYLSNTPVELLLDADKITSLKNGDLGTIGALKETAKDVLATGPLLKMAVMAETGSDALIYALEIGQAYILMVLYMMLPIGLLLSRFSIGFLMNASILIFSVIFWSALWALVAWLDNVVAGAMYDENILLTLTNHGISELNKRLAHAIAIASLYVMAPVIASWVLVAAGSRMGYAISGAAGGAALGLGGGARAAGAAAPRAISQAANKVRGGINSASSKMLPKK